MSPGYNRLGPISFGLLLSLMASAQMNEQQAIAKVEALAHLLDVPFERAQARAIRNVLPKSKFVNWMVLTGKVTAVVDDRLGYVKGLYWSVRDDEIRKGKNRSRQKFFSDEETAWRKCESLVGRLSLPFVLVRDKLHWVEDDPSANPTSRGRVYANFVAKPFGYNSFGNGNMVSLVLDTQDASVIGVTIAKGWIYDSPHIVLTRNQAIDRAKHVLQQRFPNASIANPNVVLQYAISGEGMGSETGEALRLSRHIRLGYCVHFGKHTIIIDAENGACLGGGTMA